MAVAETAQLLVNLSLEGNFASGVSNAEQTVSRLGNTTTAKTGIISSAFHSMGGAVKTFEGRVKQAGTAVLAFAGVGGLLSIGGAIESSVKKLEDFSLALEKVQTLTGESARDSGALILLFEKFGLSTDQVGQFAGFAEKTLGKLNETQAKATKGTKDATLATLELQKAYDEMKGYSTKHIDLLIKERKGYEQLHPEKFKAASGLTKLQALDQQYGLSLVDTKGKIVSYSEELRQLADFYDRNHDAATRAFVASTLLGRGYSQLAPILDQGSAAIRQAADEADSLGLGSQATAQKMVDFRNTMRDLGQQVDILQLSIGMALVPVLDDFAKKATAFIEGHRADITKFFSDLGNFAETAAGTIGDLVSTVGNFWNSIPPELRDLLIKGIVADRTVKFLFGISPIKVVASLAENAISGVGKTVAGSISQTLLGGVQKVFVVNPGFGGGGGGGGEVVAAGEGAAAEATIPGWVPLLVGALAIGEGVRETSALHDAGPAAAYQQFKSGSGGSPSAQFGPRTAQQAAAIAAAMGHGTGGLSPDDRQALSNIRRSVDTENAAVVRAIHAQRLAVNVYMSNRVNVSVADVMNAARTHATYNTGMSIGMRGALIGENG